MSSEKIDNIHKKTPVLETLFDKVAGFFYRTPLVAVLETKDANFIFLMLS